MEGQRKEDGRGKAWQEGWMRRKDTGKFGVVI